MRLDKFLKVSRLIKRRTVANEACDAGRVLVNDKTAKASLNVKEGDVIEIQLLYRTGSRSHPLPSLNVKEGDVIEIQFGTRAVKVEVLDVQETVKKDEAKELYRYL